MSQVCIFQFEIVNCLKTIMGLFDDLLAETELFEAQDLKKLDELAEDVTEDDGDKSSEIIVSDLRNLVNREDIPNILSEMRGLGTKYLTSPKETTITLGGYIVGITLMEKTDTDILEPTYQVPHIVSNFGEKTHSSIIPKSTYRKSNRGRKPKLKKQTKARQGNGTSLNSQISFSIRSAEYGQFSKMTKFKLFRDGRLQVSGAKYERMLEILDMIDVLIDLIKGTRIAKDYSYLQRLHATMENYKYSIKIGRRDAIDLSRLKTAVLMTSVEYDWNEDGLLSLLYVNYTQTQAMLCIKFDAPDIPKKKKTIAVKISVAGKINILGGLGVKYIKAISSFMNEVMSRHYDTVVVPNRDCLWSRFSLVDDVVFSADECDYIPVE